MPAITSLSISAAGPLSRAMIALGRTLARRLSQMARTVKNRHEAGTLARLDDRMLADIGLTRSDLRDAYSQPLWQDPSDVLARRAAERRGSRRQMAFERSAGCSVSPSHAAAPKAPCYPPADRPARYLM